MSKGIHEIKTTKHMVNRNAFCRLCKEPLILGEEVKSGGTGMNIKYSHDDCFNKTLIGGDD